MLISNSSRSSDRPTDWDAAYELKAFREEALDEVAKVLHRLLKAYGYMPKPKTAIEFLELFEENMCDYLIHEEDWASFGELATREDDAKVIATKAWGKALEGLE